MELQDIGAFTANQGTAVQEALLRCLTRIKSSLDLLNPEPNCVYPGLGGHPLFTEYPA